MLGQPGQDESFNLVAPNSVNDHVEGKTHPLRPPGQPSLEPGRLFKGSHAEEEMPLLFCLEASLYVADQYATMLSQRVDEFGKKCVDSPPQLCFRPRSGQGQGPLKGIGRGFGVSSMGSARFRTLR